MAEPAPSAPSPTIDPARGRRRSRFGSLRARLIASHAAVLVLAMVLVLVIGAGFLRREERRAQGEQLRSLAIPLMVEVGFLTRRPGASLPAGQRLVAEALQRQAEELGVRLLILDANGTVRFDTAATGDGDGLEGQTLAAYADIVASVEAEARRTRTVARRLVTLDGAGDPLAGNRVVVAADGRPPAVALAVVAPPRRTAMIGRFMAGLLVALVVSLGVAAGAGYLLSRRIAAPVGRLTAAADAMARGDLEQRVPGDGTDEIGRLVGSFNTMSHRVAAMDRSQRDLLANVAHELRTPLTSVRGYAQALRDGVVVGAAERERALATIGGEAERMGRLVGELLDLARLESSQVRLRREPAELAPALARVAARFAPEAKRRGVALTASVPPGLNVAVDEGRLTQILDNLVDNAIRHTPAGGSVSLSAAPGGASAAHPSGVRLVVRDSGVGIPADRLDRIFNRFTRGESPAVGESGGATGFGLGLAIVRELVAAYGGAIAVESEVGVGTTVTVDLPAAAGT